MPPVGTSSPSPLLARIAPDGLAVSPSCAMTTLRCDNSRVSQMSMGLGRTIRENLSRMFATDDRGGSQGWNPAGEVTVLRSPHQPWLEIKPHVGVPGQAGPTLKIH